MITLASDFGSPYPAAMRGVVAGRCNARLLDVTHDLPRGDVRAAAFWLRETLPWFPPAVHCAVVDPGVGTDRDAIVLRAGDHALVGPDNGSLWPAARAVGAGGGAVEEPSDGAASDADVEAFVYDYENPASSTFHGRDVFAPCAAAVHEVGVGDLESLDRIRPASDPADYRFPEPTIEADEAAGEVLVVDGFGNVVTNVPGWFLDGRDAVTVNGERVPVVRAYAAVKAGTRVATVGSHGNVELAVNDGRGDEAFGLEAGDRVQLESDDD
jgi:S-adenosylmethionine hydrolase